MKLLALGLALTLLLAHPPLSIAQEATGQREWAAIEAVPPGGELVIETKTGETVKGKLSGIAGTTLTLSRKDGSVPLELRNIRRAYRVVGRSRAKSTLIGAAAGGAAGAGIGLGIYLPARNDIVAAVIPGLGLIGAGIGAAIGAVTGSGRKRILIYEAK